MISHCGKNLKHFNHITTFLFLIASANAFQSLRPTNEIAFKNVIGGGCNQIPNNSVTKPFERHNKLLMSINQEEKIDTPNMNVEKSFDPLSLSSSSQATDSLLVDEINDELNISPSIGIWTARGLLLLVAILWGTNFASVKYLENLCFHPPCSHPPSEAALARFGVASLISLPLLLNQRKDIILAGFECGLWITLGYFTQALALSTVPSGKCAFICSLTVVVVPLISAVFFGKPIKKVNIISAALALSGVGILEGLVDFKELIGVYPAVADAESPSLIAETLMNTNLGETAVDATSSSLAIASTSAVASATGLGGWIASAMASAQTIKGDLIALGQPFGFGFAFMRIEHYVEKFKDIENRVLTISAAQCVAVGFLSFLWVLYDYHGIIPNMEYMIEPHRIGAIAWTGIMTTVVAIYFEGIALQVASATDASLLFASEPVWASLFGAWLLHEQLGLNSYIGGTAILSACLLGALADLNSEKDNSNENEQNDKIINV